MSSSHLNFASRLGRSLVVGTLAAGFAFVGTAPANAAECENQRVAPTAGNTDDIRAAILCLTNAERTQRDLRPLRENSRLRKAALAHSSDMVRNGYFAHTSPEGDTFVDRIIGAGYARRFDGWTLGENLAWGTAEIGTARGVHDAWMRSSAHRTTILKAGYRELGIGVRVGVPSDAGVGATFTTNFGVKG